MFCNKCGNELKEGAKFCSKCGAAINLEDANNSNAVLNENSESSKNVTSSQANTSNQSQNEDSQQLQKPKSKTKFYILTAIVLVMAFLIGFFIVQNIKGGGSETVYLTDIPYYTNVPWVTSMEIAQEKFEKAFNCKAEYVSCESYDYFYAVIENYEGMQGVDADITFYSKDDRKSLDEIFIFFNIIDENNYSWNNLKDEIIVKINKSLGNPSYGSEDDDHCSWEIPNGKLMFLYDDDSMFLSFSKE